MTTTKSKKEFLLNEVIPLLQNLSPDQEPQFGLMTPQHMVEHLTWTLKNCVKRTGEPEDPPTKGQLGFKKFIAKGSVLEHRPNDKTKADLPDLKYKNLEEAIEQIEVAVHRFYNHYDANPDFKCYNRFFGELGFKDLELFSYMHYRYHLWQFGLIENYPEGS